MKLYWTKADTMGSRLIRWGLNEDCSHVVVRVDLADGPHYYQSTATSGVQECTFDEFTDTHDVVHELSLKEYHSAFEYAMSALLKKKAGKIPYDWKAISFWAIAAMAKRYWGRVPPRVNMWDETGANFCVEILEGSQVLFGEHLGVEFPWPNFSMTSPHRLYEFLSSSKKFW